MTTTGTFYANVSVNGSALTATSLTLATDTTATVTSRMLLGGTVYVPTGSYTITGVGIHGGSSSGHISAAVILDSPENPRGYEWLHRKLVAGHAYELPDGATILIDDSGNFRIEDADAKVVYKANWHREFNRFVNASDLVGEFIEALGKLHATRDQAQRAPLGLFINWLIHEAAKEDGEEPPEDTPAVAVAAAPIVRPRCLDCGRFLGPNQRRIGLRFCTGTHADRYLKRIALP